jgi:acyl transferase domain-containing protein
VGLSVRVPGAANARAFWENLRNGVESITSLTDDELRAAGVTDAELGDPNYVRAAAVLQDMECWDAPFFGMSPRDASIMDPQHRLFLECCWEGLEDAGHPPERFEGSIGVFGGCGMQSYFMLNLLPDRKLMDEAGPFLVRHTGNDKDFLTTRVSYTLNLRGPSVSVQTACSTSLAAVHLACQSLLNGECDMALAGGVTILLPHRVGYHYEAGEILSPDGHCRPFDAAAQGTVFGSGAGVVVLRRLQEALSDADHVYAVIRGSAVNNDGSSKVSYLAPSVDGQAAVVAEAVAIAGVDPGSITFIEAHGTGTPVGDPIEVTALSQVYGTPGRTPCALGSVKSNVGHLDTAAGVVSLVKAVLALEHELIPPTLHYRTGNPAIDFTSGPFYVNTQAVPWWRNGAPRRAGVSSLGVGGTNAHVVLEEAPPRAPGPSADRSPQLFCLSARTRTSLEALSMRLAETLDSDPARLADVAYTLAVGRREFAERRAVVSADVRGAAAALAAPDDPSRSVSGSADGVERGVAFMFAGGGSQYVGMGRGLYTSEAVYREGIETCLQALDPQTRVLVREVLEGEPSEPLSRQIERPAVGLPALLACQIAMARLLASWGVYPSAMIGHSMGEYAAAHLAGVLSLADAMRLVHMRGRLFETVGPGGMLGVPMAAQAVARLISSEVSIAADNAPELCVASGPVTALRALEQRLGRDGIECTRIRIDIAAHSWMLDRILKEFHTFVASIPLTAPTVPFVSNLTGSWITDEAATSADYWVQHLRHTVKFAEGVTLLLSDAARVLFEVGPGRIMGTLARLNAPPRSRTPIAASMRSADETTRCDREALLLGVGELWCHGVKVDWRRVHAGTHRRVPLPTYAFDRVRHWIEAAAPRSAGEPSSGRQPLDNWFYVPDWHRVPGLADGPADRRSTAQTMLLDDGSPLGEALAEAIRSTGAPVVTVRSGRGFGRVSESAFEVDPLSVEALTRAFEHVVSGARDAEVRVVHLWSLSASVPADTFFSLIRIAQAWGRVETEAHGELVLVCSEAFGFGGGAEPLPRKALALGPIRVIPAEYPTLRTRVIDLAERELIAGRRDQSARQLAIELLFGGAAPEVALRDGERWQRVFSRVDMPVPPAGDGRLKPGGVYLVTGAFGGIGTLVAERLARDLGAKLVLVGRHAGALARDALVDRCAAAGGEALALAADVSDQRDVERLVAEARRRFGHIDGVFHAAGVLDDGLIQLRADKQCAAVLAPKVAGTEALDAALANDAPDLFVLFSSISAEAGLPGQVDYAAASAFLDAVAAGRRRRQHGLTVSVQWGPWLDVGMNARHGHAEGAGQPASAIEIRHAGVLDLQADWIVGEHRLRDGAALIPGTGYLDIACAAMAVPGRPRVIVIRDVALLQPFLLDQTTPRRQYRVLVARTAAPATFVVEGAWDKQAASWDQHAAGSIEVDAAVRRPDDSPVRQVAARCTHRVVGGPDLAAHRFLKLGSRWGSVLEVRMGDNEVLAHLRLPDGFQSDVADHRLHPALLDMATASGLSVVPDYDSTKDFYVPLAYTKVTSFEPLPGEILAHVRLVPGEMSPREVAVFDVTICDMTGRVVADIEGFMMTRVVDGAALTSTASRRRRPPLVGAPRTQSRGPGPPPDAIRADEGIEALLRVVAHRAPANVTVTWQHPSAIIRELRERARPAAAAAEARVAPEVTPVADVEAALIEHEAVAGCAALRRVDGAGTERVVAYVVFEPERQATVSELRGFVRSRVEASLVPAVFITLDRLPRDAGGEIDRASLPDPYGATEETVQPRTETERAIAEVWKNVLGIESVSVRDNFFDIGGHSLLAVRVVTRLDRTLGVRLSQAAMVLQTLEQLAAECDRQRGHVSRPAEPVSW